MKKKVKKFAKCKLAEGVSGKIHIREGEKPEAGSLNSFLR